MIEICFLKNVSFSKQLLNWILIADAVLQAVIMKLTNHGFGLCGTGYIPSITNKQLFFDKNFSLIILQKLARFHYQTVLKCVSCFMLGHL